MGTRELKGLLRVLKDAGVASFTSGDLSVTFRDLNEHQTPTMFMGPEQGTGDGASADPMDLPDGIYDPRRRLAEINRKRAERAQ